jgi:SulP family sulfate permease
MFELIHRRRHSIKDDILSGLTVALALVPEAIAFAFVAGVEPLVGLYAAFMVGLITATMGGRPGMISGATGALAVVMVALVADHGVEYLFAAVVLMGVLQITAGAFRLGKFIRMVPHPVMLGFVNGLAIVIFLAQLGQFGIPGDTGWLQDTSLQGSILDVAWISGMPLYTMLGLVGLTMLIIQYLPKLTTAVPSSLVAIITVTLVVLGLDLDTKVVGDVASIAGSLPSFHLPMVPMNLETLGIILPYAFILAAIGLIESLLTLSLVDELTQTRGRGNKECVAQGVANTVTGVFGGMGGCAMIGQSMINVNAGGRGRLSGITAALCLLMFILVGSSLIEKIPLAALVVVGVIVAALVFAWEHAKHVKISLSREENGWDAYTVNGPLFFGSVTHFLNQFDVEQGSQDIVIDFKDSRVCDHSGLEAIDTLAERFTQAGKVLHIRHLSAECRTLLRKAGNLVEVSVLEDPSYFVATDSLA